VTTTVSKAKSLWIVTGAYVIAIAAAWAWLLLGPTTGRPWLDTLVADLIGTVVIFVFSRIHRNSSFYDAYWSVIPPLLLFYWWSQAEPGVGEMRAWLVAFVVMLWAIRLTFNWIRGFPGLHHEDWRYPMFKERAGKFEFFVDLFAIHLIPTVQVFVGMLPVYVAVTRPGVGLPWLAWVATVIGVGAVVLEYVADQQMYRFAETRAPGEAMDRGLWGWSRHPNYFGEFSFWFAMALFGVAAAPQDAWWLFVGAAIMLALFLFASIPMMEERSLDRRPEYRQVIDRVSRFVPWPPKKAAA